jgi:dipeptidyl aminopeptidase/acylaminoacyl peptidase
MPRTASTPRTWRAARALWPLAITLLAAWLLVACEPSPEANVAGYLVARQLGSFDRPPSDQPPGAVEGRVLHGGAPVAGAAVVIAERTGRPHAARTDADGRYRIDGLPPGQYVPAAVAAGYDEAVPRDDQGRAQVVTVSPGAAVAAPAIQLEPHQPAPLPAPLPEAVALRATASYTATALFPPGAAASVQAFEFTRDGVLNSNLRVYLPLESAAEEQLPLLFIVYPGWVDGWEPVSVAMAAQGFAVVAISPAAAWGTDIDAHVLDARVALRLAVDGLLGPHIDAERAVALGGSFSSAILHRLLRDEGERFAAWVTAGGIGDAFAAAEEFYAGRIEMPAQYEYLVPSLGAPNLFPLNFLRYSPLYTADQLPPSFIIHTAADRILPLSQATALEAALAAAGVPVETFYYEDVSHYLQVDENMTDAGREMFWRIVNFARRWMDAVVDYGQRK